jgi:hypothetical protein
MMNDELREVRTLLNAIAQQMELLQWVNGYAVGANEGGSYVSLFNDRLQYRVCTVYQERFRDLPAFITDNIPDEAVDISNDRTVLEKKGLLRPCSLFQIVRYKIGEGEKAAWRFSGVVRVSQPRQEEQPQAQSAPAPASTQTVQGAPNLLAQLNVLGGELYGASWPDVRQRNVHRITGGQTDTAMELTPEQVQKLIDGMMKVKAKRQPPTSPDVQFVEDRFDAVPKQPLPARGGSGSAGQQMRERMAAQPGYAG